MRLASQESHCTPAVCNAFAWVEAGETELQGGKPLRFESAIDFVGFLVGAVLRFQKNNPDCDVPLYDLAMAADKYVEQRFRDSAASAPAQPSLEDVAREYATKLVFGECFSAESMDHLYPPTYSKIIERNKLSEQLAAFHRYTKERGL